MEHKTILVTGATQGLGKVTATELAKQGHHIILHGRNISKLEEVRNDIVGETGNKKIDIIIADLLSLSETARMAGELKKKYNKLDVLVNNAGAFFNKQRETTKEGFEKTIALNLFAPLLLMQSLSELLAKSLSARIVNVSSAMHKRGGKPDFNDFQLQNSYKPARAYSLSKLYLIWVSRHMVKYLQEHNITNVSVNVCHPGAAATNFGQDSNKGFLIDLVFKIAMHFTDKPEQGAMTSIYLATSPALEKITGKFFGNRKNIEKPDDKYYSRENEQKVWDYCQQILKPYL